MLLRLSPPGEQRLFDSPELQTFFGGAEANVAVALTHLGLEADYVTRLPEGPLGDAALDALRREGVGPASILRPAGDDRASRGPGRCPDRQPRGRTRVARR